MRKWAIAVLAAVMLCGCSSKPKTITITNPVQLATSTPDMSGYTLLQDSSPAFAEISLKESIRMFSEGGTGILYYGKADCGWCTRAVPELNTVAKECGVTVYYVDVAKEVTDEDYNTLIDDISEIFITDTTGQKSFLVPEVIAVKNGKIVDHHLSLVDEFEMTDDSAQMTDIEKKELQNIYQKLMTEIAD